MKILVTGATGNIGRKVVDHLIALGADDIRALSNKPERAALPDGVEVVRGYLRRVETLPAAFEGVDRMYLAPVLETVGEVVELARAAGVRHIVDLSGDESTDWQPIAKAVEKSGVDWTHLYTGEFVENTTMWAEQIRSTGEVREPYPDAANAPIAMDDIARVAAAVLTQDGHAGVTYTLTGPETLTRVERVRQLGVALGCELSFVTVPREEAIALLEPQMGEFAAWYVDGLAAMAEHPQRATTTVADLTGRPATTFAEWAAANADEFR
ncbi:NAD(P)H-binding protein [Nocardia transvalensis]|uniref:NAD(P)H-binding protein n=1 Tax=Nocardia transvalensis TaxID=37333 RepID=UPI00189542B4|nr:NAD(P)H-binding protein [Nocardia transvalensis]MBF6331602.1 NAD(P)H-binding protein [Nocardia transvalensis]